MNSHGPAIGAVIPSYRVRDQVLGVIASIGTEVRRIYVVDDACPQQSGKWVEEQCRDQRVRVLYNSVNLGVGGATMTGYRQAIADGLDVVVKIDGDGQMDGSLIPRLVDPVLRGEADYVKGNRFFDVDSLGSMPRVRLFGNSMLSLVSKAASGYWDIMDPTNGFTAVHTAVLRLLPLDKIDRRYFFESDMLCRLNTVRAVVVDMPMEAVYLGGPSSLNSRRVAAEFPGKYLWRFLVRLFYNYILRDFNAGTIQFLAGLLLLGRFIGKGQLRLAESFM